MLYMLRGVAVACLPLAILAWGMGKPLVAGVFIMTSFFAGGIEVFWLSAEETN